MTDRLIDVRKQIHWAAQAASSVGKQLLPHQHDFSEQSFQWIAGSGVLAQGLVSGPRPFRSALRIARPALLLLGGDGAVLREMPLEGRTLDQAYEWVREEVESLLGRPLEKPLERGEGIPAHPAGEGAAFAIDAEGAAELERRFAGAERALRRTAAANPNSSPVRCWPHHFDIAILIALDPGASDPETARSIGVGMSPGDDGRQEPYYYVLPWPPPKDRDLPALDGGGSWHTEDWIGAVLEGDQEVDAFLDSAVAACRTLLS